MTQAELAKQIGVNGLQERPYSGFLAAFLDVIAKVGVVVPGDVFDVARVEGERIHLVDDGAVVREGVDRLEGSKVWIS